MIHACADFETRFVSEVQLTLTYLKDNGQLNKKFGEYAVDGLFRQRSNNPHYQSAGDQKPELFLQIEEGAEVHRVQILQRFVNSEQGLYQRRRVSDGLIRSNKGELNFL